MGIIIGLMSQNVKMLHELNGNRLKNKPGLHELEGLNTPCISVNWPLDSQCSLIFTIYCTILWSVEANCVAYYMPGFTMCLFLNSGINKSCRFINYLKHVWPATGHAELRAFSPHRAITSRPSPQSWTHLDRPWMQPARSLVMVPLSTVSTHTLSRIWENLSEEVFMI